VEYINEWCERRDNHPPEGTYIRLGAKYLHQVGCVPMEEIWPYNSPKPENLLFEETISKYLISSKNYKLLFRCQRHRCW
jgi:hypothetical protein